jgi:hypothetical protein
MGRESKQDDFKSRKGHTLADLFDLADQCHEDSIHGLAKKLEILTDAQVLIGRYHSASVRAYKHAYAKRKAAFADAYMSVKRDKNQFAEQSVVKHRMEEADLEAIKVKWQNAFQSNLEVINSLKYALRAMIVEY